jgi:hypothetical protein
MGSPKLLFTFLHTLRKGVLEGILVICFVGRYFLCYSPWAVVSYLIGLTAFSFLSFTFDSFLRLTFYLPAYSFISPHFLLFFRLGFKPFRHALVFNFSAYLFL